MAFSCYRATLLPGLDLGDSASFQTVVGSLTLTPRHAYPLYYALGNIFAWLDPHEPAHAMNLASAVYGALAAGVAVLVAIELTASLAAGMSAGLFLAFSYTFWSQAITAEVYTLHLLILGCCLLALLAWENAPTFPKLALFYSMYALGFGNHLSMVLLLPGFALFLLMTRRPGAADPLAPRAVAAAAAIAVLGALQYSWNFAGLWTTAKPPASLGEALGQFWFDVTKADWRETLVMGVSEQGLQSRPAMYWWDLRQQFGIPGVALAVAGLVYLLRHFPRRAVLVLALYLTGLAFAWTYNVGDAYVFFLPSHYLVALCAGAGLAAVVAVSCQLSAISSQRTLSSFLVALGLAYPAWRAYDDLPALDRTWDSRATLVLDEMTAPVTRDALCQDSVFSLDANWQVQNAAEYYMREHKPGTPWFVTEELEWLSPARPFAFDRFVADNDAHIVLTADTLARVASNGGSKLRPFGITHPRPLVEAIPPNTKGFVYALTVLRPYRETPIDSQELSSAWKLLAGDTPLPAIDDFSVVVGRVGESPTIVKTDRRPFRVKSDLGTLHVDVRMESWLPTDTIRRSGFGHVIVNRRHVLAIDRGISLVLMPPAGLPVLTAYRSGLFAPVQRFVPGADGTPVPCYR